MFIFNFKKKRKKLKAYLIKVPEVIGHYVRQETFHAVLHEEIEEHGVLFRIYYSTL